MQNPIAGLIALAKKGDKRVLLGGAAVIGGGVGLFMYLHRGATGSAANTGTLAPGYPTAGAGGDTSGGGAGGGGSDLSALAPTTDTSGAGTSGGLGPLPTMDTSGLGVSASPISAFDSGMQAALPALPALADSGAGGYGALPSLTAGPAFVPSTIPQDVGYTGTDYGAFAPTPTPGMGSSAIQQTPAYVLQAQTKALNAARQAEQTATQQALQLSTGGSPAGGSGGALAAYTPTMQEKATPALGPNAAQQYYQQAAQQQQAATLAANTTAPTQGPNAAQQYYAALAQRNAQQAAINAQNQAILQQQQQAAYNAAIAAQNRAYQQYRAAPSVSAPAPAYGPNAAQAYYAAQAAQQRAAIPQVTAPAPVYGPNAAQQYYAQQKAPNPAMGYTARGV